MITRRTLLTGLAAGALAPALAQGASAALRIGDQKGGAQALMKAAAVLDGVSYPVTWTQFAAAAPLLEALNAEAVDLALAGDAPTTFALAAGTRAKIVGGTRASGAGTAILVPKDSPVRSAADLKGRTIAVNRGSIGHALVIAVTETQGWDVRDIKIANLLPTEAKSALAAGAVDAWCSWGVYVAQGRLVDGYRVVADGTNGLLTGLSFVVATQRAIASQHEALLDFTRRYAAAKRWAQSHPDDYARVLAGEIGVSQPVARLTFEAESGTPVVIDERVIADEQRTIDRYVKARLIPERLEAKGLFDPAFNAAVAG